MEAASLTVGTVTLVSLLTTCVECFEYIDAAKSCGRDLELLKTKFAVEKARLLIWGDSVGLSSTNTARCNTIEAPRLRPIVEQILDCIRLLFDDTDALATRYGLKPTSNDASLSITANASDHQGLPLRLKASYGRFRSRIEDNHKRTIASRKTRWAIRDKQKFANLVEEIHQFIDGLEALTDSVEMGCRRAALIREELSTVEDPEDLRLIAEASAGRNVQGSDAASVALGASVCETSGHYQIRDWMSAVSDSRWSNVVECEGPEASRDLLEPSITDFLGGTSPPSPPFGRLGSSDWHDQALILPRQSSWISEELLGGLGAWDDPCEEVSRV